jgi:hypothetical protein
MGARIANGLLLAAGMATLLGAAAFAFGAGVWSWRDLTVGVRWYGGVQGRSPAVLAAAIGAAAIGALALVVALRERRRWKGTRTRSDAVDAKRLRRVRQHLDRELCRPSPRREIVVDALLGELVDLEARALLLAPAGMVTQVSFEIGGELLPLTTMPEALYGQVRAQLQLLVDAPGDGEGRLDFRSSTRVDELRVLLGHDAQGPTVLVQVLRRHDPSEIPPSSSPRPSARRRNVSTLVRLESPPAAAGEPRALLYGEDDPTDSRSGLLVGLDPSAESEVAPLVAPRAARPLGRLESGLLLTTTALLLCAVTSFFAPAYSWGVKRLGRGENNAPWRQVAVEITSRPAGASVTIAARRRGQTPLRTSAECRDLPITVVVEAADHVAWQWHGVCPSAGPLVLHAALLPR